MDLQHSHTCAHALFQALLPSNKQQTRAPNTRLPSQIRNYVLHPYKLAKDTRTGHETADVAAVLDGDLGPFMTAYLRHRSRQAAEERLSAVS